VSDRSRSAISQSGLVLTNCDREPIHIPGAVQPHGVMVVLHPVDLTVLQATTNVASIFGLSLNELLGSSLDLLLGIDSGPPLLNSLRELPRKPRASYLGQWPIELRQTGKQAVCDVIAHRNEAGIVVEFEFQTCATCRGGFGSLDFDSIFERLMLSLDEAEAIADMGLAVCEVVHTLTGFDRVLIYQFEENWNGKVVSEFNAGPLPSYMHHRFPAADIPAQARELYRINTNRIIPTADFQPVAIEPVINPLTQKPLDMTASVLRSVSPVHVEYMKNMNTAASMSVSILRRGKLWGLIACHHSEVKHVPYPVRTACEHFVRAFSLRLSALEHIHDFERHAQVRTSFAKLLARMAHRGDFVAALRESQEELLMLAGAQGAAVITADEFALIGATPTEKQVRALGQWLFSTNRSDVYDTDSLAAEYPLASEFRDRASGLLAVSISKLHPSYVMWFRPEVIGTIQWAGEPTKDVRGEANQNGTERLHPRQSFATWKETVRDRSLAWSVAERDGAAELRNAIVGIVLRKAEELAELNEELQRSNRELEAFSYSVSHDLRAPLRHIVGYAEILRASIGETISDKDNRCIATIIESSEYAGRLVDKLLAYSRLGQAELQRTPIDLNLLVSEVRKDVMREAEDREIEWRVDSLPEVYADVMMLRMATRDLLSNAVKYTRSRDKAVIEIGSRIEDSHVVVWIKDNGVGFDMQYADKLFGVFQRLHRWEDFEGTGIGLANVRRVIERHGGRTWADAREGQGATFFLTLPPVPEFERERNA
jgi:two-component system, chemotaxis family, sensor kinase Cph1